MIFNRSHVTVRMCKRIVVASRLITGLYWMVAVLSSVDAPLAVDSLTDVDVPD